MKLSFLLSLFGRTLVYNTGAGWMLARVLRKATEPDGSRWITLDPEKGTFEEGLHQPRFELNLGIKSKRFDISFESWRPLGWSAWSRLTYREVYIATREIKLCFLKVEIIARRFTVDERLKDIVDAFREDPAVKAFNDAFKNLQ